jgi:unsaturated rhamnogalacturonyl hydrolase
MAAHRPHHSLIMMIGLAAFGLSSSIASAQTELSEKIVKRQRDYYHGLLKEYGKSEGWLVACGISRNYMPMWAVMPPEMFDLKSKKTRILVVYDFAHYAKSAWPRDKKGRVTDPFRDFFRWFYNPKNTISEPYHSNFVVGIIPNLRPDSAISTDVNWIDRKPPGRGYPPKGVAYGDLECPEREYLWRYIGMVAPDLVVQVHFGRGRIRVSGSPNVIADLSFARGVPGTLTLPTNVDDADWLAFALPVHSPAGVAPIPAVELQTRGTIPTARLLRHLSRTEKPLRSPARKELLRRQARTPIQVATELAKVYGHNLNSVAYIPALALIGRCRLGELTGDDSHLADVEKIVSPYFSDEKPTMGKRVGGSNLSGHLVFGELAARTQKTRYLELATLAADLGFDEDGEMKESMPHHSEMSDAVFMGTPILVQTGRLTGKKKYFDMAARHLEFMLKLNLREDGLHQHSPLDPGHTAWGRGNGFPALGLALCLTDLPEDNPHRKRFLEVYRNHMAAMNKHQDEMGMWHQVVDHPESYREFTVTCMTTFAMTRGLRRGWLNRKTYEPVVVRAWQAIKTRIGNGGNLVDVCTGTGKQKSFRDYLDRTAILGRDDRGGAMALMVSTEIAFAQREKAITVPVAPKKTAD